MLLILIISIAVIIVVTILTIHFKRPEVRGRIGESEVKSIIGKTIENEKYVINDLIIENEGKTSQIDHIVINPRGVFVIETKNYSGTIYGSENQQEWTQVLAYGKVKNKIYNPVKQNATHVYHIRKIIGNLPIYPLVVFTQNNTYNINVKTVIPLFALKGVLQSGEDTLSITQMKTAYDVLLSRKSAITTEDHIDNIMKQKRDLAYGICPRCGGKLVLRNGKYGSFWGCSNYPKCKFIKKT